MDEPKLPTKTTNQPHLLFNHPAWRSYDNYDEPSILFSGFIIRCLVSLYVGAVLSFLILGVAFGIYFSVRVFFKI